MSKSPCRALVALGLLALICLGACRPAPEEPLAPVRTEPDLRQEEGLPAPAELVLTNARIYTVEEAQPWAEAIAIDGGEIVFVGAAEEAEAWIGEATEVLDLDGRLVLPGLHDVHLHPLEASSFVAGTCLLEADWDPEDYVPALRDCAPEQIGTDWVLGWGHSLWDLQASERLPREILDEAIPDRPAVMMERSSHSAWANSLALEAAGWDESAADPPAGFLGRDPETGALDGIVYENAGNMLFDLALAPSPELAELDYEALLEGLAALGEAGITSIADARSYRDRGHLEIWERAEREDQLSVRATLGLWAYPHYEDEAQLRELAALYRRDPGALLQVGQVKLYADGVLDSGTAALLAPYDEDLGVAGPRGMRYFDRDRMQRYAEALGPLGYDLHIHTIGDGAVRDALDAIEAARAAHPPDAPPRHRLTHLELVDPADRARFAELGVIADLQVAGDFALPEHAADLEPLIGERAFDMLPLRGLHDAGARVTLSSDWDVSELSPFLGMRNALLRGEQGLPDLESAIRAYTIDAAYALRQEDLTGSIAVGKAADLVVLDRDIFAIDPEEIGETEVLLTLLGGEEVYRGPGLGR